MEHYRISTPSASDAINGEIKRTRDLFNPHLTLGFFALEKSAQNAEATYQLFMNPGSQHEETELLKVIATNQSEAQKNITVARNALASDYGPKNTILTAYLNTIAPKAIADPVRKIQNTYVAENAWSVWVRDCATDEQILDVLAEHSAVILEHTENTRIHQRIDVLSKNVLDSIDYLDGRGHIGSEPRHPDGLAVYYGDIFDTYIKGRAGYYETAGFNHIVLGQALTRGEGGFAGTAMNTLPSVLTHEWVHGLLCRSWADTSSPLATRWINEAVTEMLSRKIRTHGGETVFEDNTYISERLLVAEILRPFNDQRAAEADLFRAYTGTDDDRQLFVEKVDAVFDAKDVLEKVTVAIAMAEKRLAKRMPVDRRIECDAINEITRTLLAEPENVLLRGIDIPTVEEAAAALIVPKK